VRPLPPWAGRAVFHYPWDADWGVIAYPDYDNGMPQELRFPLEVRGGDSINLWSPLSFVCSAYLSGSPALSFGLRQPMIQFQPELFPLE